MKKILLLLLLAISLTSQAQSNEHRRKKVAVVLSGGGAKGAAHARALKVIEEAGIPVDYVVGTSMGALVGALYATGYNANQIDSIMCSQKWNTLLTDAVERKRITISKRQLTDKYALSINFEKTPTEVIEGGLLKGNNVAMLISQLTADYPDSMSFSKLPIPFACVATDIVTGKEVDMRSGVLAECLRASMSIPGVFAPVKKGGMVLVDGGMTNNYPVDLARQMGADYVIGVGLSETPLSYDKIKNTQDVLLQIVDNMTRNKLQENIDQTDVFIKVDVTGYSAASFTNAAIDTLLTRGETAARSKWDELIALRKTIGVSEPLPAPAPRPLPRNMNDVMPPSTIYRVNQKINFLGAGLRFDNEELASIILGGKYEFNKKHHLAAGVEARLGRRIDALAYGTINMGPNWNTQLSYNFYRNDSQLHNYGSMMQNIIYTGHRVQLDFSRSWHNIRLTFGGEYSFYHFNDIFTKKNYEQYADDSSEQGISYFTRLTFDNRDRRSNAHRGMEWSVGYKFLTDNGYSYCRRSGLHIVDIRWNIAIPLSRTSTLTPYVSGRWMPNHNRYFTQANLVGGVNMDGHYMPQQLSFAGINYMQIAKSLLLIGGIKFRQDLFKKHYAFAIFNYGYSRGESDLIENISRETGKLGPIHMYGAAIGYGINTPIGPVELNLNWSNITKKLGAFANIGFMF